VKFLARFPAHRLELLISVLLISASGFLVWLCRSMGDLSSMLDLVTLELILPLALGLMAAGLLAGDPCLDLLLTTHRPAWRVLLERICWLFVVGSLLGTILLFLSDHWGIYLPRDGTDRLFIWLSPLVFCLGLSSASSLLRGRALDGVLATAAWMGISLVALSQIPRGCASFPPGMSCPLWLASPLMTLGNPGDDFWPLNRIVWLGVGLLLLACSFQLARREEPLLSITGEGNG
jgi:hypothetical protein